MIRNLATLLILSMIIFSIMSMNMKKPVAEKIPHEVEINGTKLVDNYHWLRDSNWPEPTKNEAILSYLGEENEYSKSFFDKQQDIKDHIFEELKGRVELESQSPYIQQDNYFYYTRTEKDSNYPIYCRKKDDINATEEVYLDINQLAENHKFTNVRSVAVSPDHKIVAYGIDHEGNEKFTIKFYDIHTKKHIEDIITNTSGKVVWHNDNSKVFYTLLNKELRPDTVKSHILGQQNKEDKVILHETNPIYYVGIGKSQSDKFMMISIGGHDSNEVSFLDLDSDDNKPKTILPRQDKVKYSVHHNGDNFYIHSNLDSHNFAVYKLPIGSKEISDFIPAKEDQYLEDVDMTADFIILNYKIKGQDVIYINKIDGSNRKKITFPDAAYTAGAYSTNYHLDDLRIFYSSLSRPNTTYKYHFDQDALAILKVQNIPSGHNSKEYQVERIWADNNGTKVPISIMYKKSLFKKDGSNPLYLYGYGSYGIGMSPTFRNSAITLANRGFVFAIAHIRGGDELGHEWYESAKFLNKKNTFNDFITCAEYLIEEKYTSEGEIVIVGGSAGGMLIGTAINERPELFKAAIAHVPFVDVLNTMLDETLPLTPNEYKEWGNPKDKEYFEYMKSYSPYDNVKKQNYPHLFITAGLTDPRVGYWEAAKWAAKLREYKTDNNDLLLKTNMDAGHQGASGRFDYLKEAANDYVFIFSVFNKDRE